MLKRISFLVIQTGTFGLIFLLHGFSTTYQVGPGQPLSTLSEVPWESIGAGDSVKIFHNNSVYRDKWVICAQGTQNQPIVIKGIINTKGQRPVIDGGDAVTRQQLNFWNESRGIIKIGGANVPADKMPKHILIENLEIKSGRPGFQFTGRTGVSSYADNAAAVYIEKGENIIIRNCIFTDCGNGLFCGNGTENLLVEGCYYLDNGIENSIYQHNNYTEARGITFQFNRFGPLRANCPGNNLKDRSSGCVIRYNWIEGGNRQLDLVDSDVLKNDPAYRESFVYGNILIEPDGAGNSQVIHYGGDSGDESKYRKGTLYFYHNTVISARSGNTTLLRLSSSGEKADIRNNIFYGTASGNRQAILADKGTADLRNNWLKQGWRNSHSPGPAQVTELGGEPNGK